MKNKLVLNAVFFLLAVGVGVGLSIKPWQVYKKQREAADAAIVDMKAAEKDQAALMRKKARFESAVGKEELARNEGFRQKNETPVDPEGSAATPATP